MCPKIEHFFFNRRLKIEEFRLQKTGLEKKVKVYHTSFKTHAIIIIEDYRFFLGGSEIFHALLRHVNNPLAKLFFLRQRAVKSKVTWPSEREAWRSPRKIFEWVVLPLFFLTLFGSHRYTFLGPTRSSLSGRGITNVSPFIFGSSWIGSCQIFRSWALKVHSCLQRLFYDHHLLIPLKKGGKPLSCANVNKPNV